jgi:hypothetical protein
MPFHILKVYQKIFQENVQPKQKTYKGKTIIVKNLLISYCGFEIEIEMKGIPDKLKKKKLKH